VPDQGRNVTLAHREIVPLRGPQLDTALFDLLNSTLFFERGHRK